MFWKKFGDVARNERKCDRMEGEDLDEVEEWLFL